MDGSDDLFVEAKAFEDQGRFDMAAEKYRQILELAIGDRAIAYQGLGRALVRLGRLDEGALACQEALKMNPDLYLAHGVLGYVYLARREYELAKAEFQTATRLQPNEPITLTNLALAYYELGQYEETVEICEKLLEIQPDKPEIRLSLANAYLAQRHTRRAVTEFYRAFSMNPALLVRYPYVPLVVAVSASLQYLNRLNFLVRLGAGAGLLLVAMLAPTHISVPIGVLGSILVAFIVLANLWVQGDKRKYLLFSLSLSFLCIVYWIFVLIRRSL